MRGQVLLGLLLFCLLPGLRQDTNPIADVNYVLLDGEPVSLLLGALEILLDSQELMIKLHDGAPGNHSRILQTSLSVTLSSLFLRMQDH